MTIRLQSALSEAEAPSVPLLIEAFDAIHGAGSPARERMMNLLALEAWWDAARLLVPFPWKLCVSEQVPGGAWAALGMDPTGALRQWQHHGRAKTVPHAIAVVSLMAKAAA